MNYEIYRECLVERQRSNKDRLLEMGLLLLGAVCCVGAVFVSTLCFLGAAACVAGWYWSINFNHVEYEYMLLDDQVTVSVIYNKKRRKEVGEYQLKQVLAAADTSDERLERIRKNGTVLCDYSSRALTGRQLSLFVKNGSGKTEEVRFSPDETMYKLMMQKIPTLAKRLEMF